MPDLDLLRVMLGTIVGLGAACFLVPDGEAAGDPRRRDLVPPPGRDMMQEHLAGSHGRPETECPRYDHELRTGARCAGRRARLPGRERRTQRQVAPLRYSDARPSCMGEQ